MIWCRMVGEYSVPQTLTPFPTHTHKYIALLTNLTQVYQPNTMFLSSLDPGTTLFDDENVCFMVVLLASLMHPSISNSAAPVLVV